MLGDLLLRKDDNTARIQMDAAYEQAISHYFSLLEEIMKANDLTG